MERVPVFAANWKMNKSLAEVGAYVAGLSDRLISQADKKLGHDYEVVVAPSALHLPLLTQKLVNTQIEAGAQNCGYEKAGAYTGEVSPTVLSEVGCRWVIVGHSERRHVFKETDELVSKRMRAALAERLRVIFCVGETLEQRKAGRTFDVVDAQLSVLKDGASDLAWSNLVVAYEPVWAIGTGETATPEQAEEVHAHIRKWLAGQGWSRQAGELRILYGGSVNPGNAQVLMDQADVDGLLVGGASLDATKFAELVVNGLKSYA